MHPSTSAPALPSPDDEFLITERGGYRLVVPSKTKWTWRPEETFWRSVIVDAEGHPVSVGFPKFFNVGEQPDNELRLARAMAEGRVTFTDKLDGSLIIRSVIDGEVVFRTRGTFDGGDAHGPAVRALVARRYPQLLDASLEPERSLLFEFVSPDFTIVIPYPEADLVLLGGTEHRPGGLLPRTYAAELARECRLPLVRHDELPSDLAQMRETVQALTDREGVVASIDDGAELLKVKGARYLAAHAMRFSFVPRRIAEYARERDIREREVFVETLRADGYDWEIAEQTLGAFDLIAGAMREADERLAEAEAFTAAHEGLSRKEFAALAAEQDRTLRPALFMCLDGQVDRARDKLSDGLVRDAVREANRRGLVFSEA